MTWEDVTQRLDAVCDAVECLRRNLAEFGFHVLFGARNMASVFGKVLRVEGSHVTVSVHGIEVPIELDPSVADRLTAKEVVQINLLEVDHGSRTLVGVKSQSSVSDAGEVTE